MEVFRNNLITVIDAGMPIVTSGQTVGPMWRAGKGEPRVAASANWGMTVHKWTTAANVSGCVNIPTALVRNLTTHTQP